MNLNSCASPVVDSSVCSTDIEFLFCIDSIEAVRIQLGLLLLHQYHLLDISDTKSEYESWSVDIQYDVFLEHSVGPEKKY